MAILQYIIFRTRLGRAMRAVSFNHDLASLMGIPTNRVISATFMLGSALAGAGGVLVGLTYPKIEPLMGTMPGLKAFVAAVLVESATSLELSSVHFAWASPKSFWLATGGPLTETL